MAQPATVGAVAIDVVEVIPTVAPGDARGSSAFVAPSGWPEGMLWCRD